MTPRPRWADLCEEEEDENYSFLKGGKTKEFFELITMEDTHLSQDFEMSEKF